MCDAEGPELPAGHCMEQYPEDAGAYTDISIRELRAMAKADGWRATIYGQDLCPNHVDRSL